RLSTLIDAAGEVMPASARTTSNATGVRKKMRCPLWRQPVLGAGHGAKIVEHTRSRVHLRVGRKGQLGRDAAVEPPKRVAQRARVVVAAVGGQRVGVEAVRQATFPQRQQAALPQRQQVATVRHEAGVGGVLELRFAKVGAQPAGQVGAEAAV
nr:hypothetical protein [Tanacetum cinerariifolium]